ncbi:hypothetical protein Lser_V15G12448 [Lactuca serriola]
MAKNKTSVSSKREKSDEEKDINCKRRIKGLLQLIGYQCPTTDSATLRAEAERKLNEIKERKHIHQDSSSLDIVACEIKKRKPSTTGRVYGLDSNLTKDPSTSRSHNRGWKCRKLNHDENTTQQTELPPKVKSYIKKIKGSEKVEFVFEKLLTRSDVNKGQGRLLMPLKQVKRRDIFFQMEKLREVVRVYVPSREEHYEVCLTQWNMNGNHNFVLKSGWNQVVNENGLDDTKVVQLWSFQVGDTPSLLLVLVDDGNGDESDDDGGIYGVPRSGGVIIRESRIGVTSSTSEDETSLRSRKGKRKLHEL